MLNRDYRDILQNLLDEKAEFLIVGAYAMAAHGHPRATGDLDLWIKPEKHNAKKVYLALAKFGAPLDQLRAEDLEQNDIIFQIGVAPRRIDILTHIDGVDFLDAEQNKSLIQIGNLNLPVISKKLLIQNKEASGREKDKVDAEILRNNASD